LKTVNVGLLGLGTVGGGTATVLSRNAEEISRRIGCEIKITHAAAKEIEHASDLGLGDIKLSTDAANVIGDESIDIIVELIGGYEPARTFVLQAIENGKHVVTANKALIAKHGNEIFEAAEKKGVSVCYEAAVAGGIPIIKAMRESLAANKVNWLAGIINGTGNFILTEMRDKGRDFADVLKEAQQLGYAEADPTFDVEGIDAAHKLAILASLAFGMPLSFDKVFTEGITKITSEDVVYANELGYRIKHLGLAVRTDNGIEMRVHPTLIPEGRLIANVDGVMNAVLVECDALGPSLYYGAGAGAEPTASAVVADITDLARAIVSDTKYAIPHLSFQADSIQEQTILAIDEIETAYYIRLNADDEAGVMAEISGILAENQISIDAIVQNPPVDDSGNIPIVILTHRVKEKKMNDALEQIKALEHVEDDLLRIRVESLG
jgi:homoserine dehydrogenase